jgi:hypothetical protein
VEALQREKLTNNLRADPHGSARPDLSPALGMWFNCNLNTGEILSLLLTEGREGLVLRAYGLGNSSALDWGETAATPHVASLTSREFAGFTARYDFGFKETQIAANLKFGVLVIQSYNTFRDGSGRPAYFVREFFHQKLSSADPAIQLTRSDDAAITCMMASDDPRDPLAQRSGKVNLTPMLGSWRNTYRGSTGIHRVILAREGGHYTLQGWGVGYDDDWGKVPVLPHANGVASYEPAGFLARYDFGFSELSLAANEAKGLLIIASFSTFRDGSGRSSYFTREFFYRERDGLPS